MVVFGLEAMEQQKVNLSVHFKSGKSKALRLLLILLVLSPLACRRQGQRLYPLPVVKKGMNKAEVGEVLRALNWPTEPFRTYSLKPENEKEEGIYVLYRFRPDTTKRTAFLFLVEFQMREDEFRVVKSAIIGGIPPKSADEAREFLDHLSRNGA